MCVFGLLRSVTVMHEMVGHSFVHGVGEFVWIPVMYKNCKADIAGVVDNFCQAHSRTSELDCNTFSFFFLDV